MAVQETFRLAFPDVEDPPYIKLSYGLPFTDAVSKHVTTTFNAKRAYIIASPSLSKQTSNLKELETALGARHAGTWLGIRPHTPWDDLVPIIHDMRSKQADCLITLGGGSIADGAKVIIYAIENGVQTVADIEAMTSLPSDGSGANSNGSRRSFFVDKTGVGNPPRIPIICIPTTLSAGEYSKFGGGTSPRTHLKSILTHPRMYPFLVVLDPRLTLTTPRWTWLSTGVRAVDHCCEAFCSPHGADHPAAAAAVAAAAKPALRALLAGLLESHRGDWEGLAPRLECQLAANSAMVALLWAPAVLMMGASHGIGHQLGPLGVGHGQTSCILLPATMKYNARVNGARQAELRDHVWGDERVAAVLREAGLSREGSDLGDALDAVFRALGMPRTLAEVGVGREQLDLVAENSLKDPCCKVNPIPMERKEQVLEILEAVIG